MKDTFKVIKPFLMLEEGDVLVFDSVDDMYVSEYSSVYGEDVNEHAEYTSKCKLSPKYVLELEDQGYIEEVKNTEEEKTPKFVNVFDEIDTMLASYKEDLANIDIDEENTPACLKVEKETVLKNLIKALNHLKELKK